MEPIKVVVVDDNTTFLRAAMLTLSMLPNVYVVGSARSGATALAMAQLRGPDLIVMDVNMAGMDGPATARELRARGCTAKIILVSMGDRSMVQGCELGVHYDGFVSKADFAVGIQQVVTGMLGASTAELRQ